MVATIIIILLSMLFSAYFSGMEIAFISSNRMHIELERKKKALSARLFTYLADKPKQFITTMLVGNNLALVVYGYFMGILLTQIFSENFGWQNEGPQLLLQTIISTLVILIFAEFLPKSLFSLNPSLLLKKLTFPTYILFQIFKVPSWIIMQVSNLFIKILGGKEDIEQEIFLKEELKYFIDEQINHTDEIDTEVQIFQNALDFIDTKVRDCKIPRKEIVGIEKLQDIETLKEKFIETGYSKIIVYSDNIDNIIGYVHSFDLFKQPKSITQIMLPVEFVRETDSAKEVMDRLIKKRKSIAIALDEYGGTSGIVTVEDIIEELFGEIEDEHDQADSIEEHLSNNEFLFSARLEIDYLNQEYQLELPTNERYETLGGLLTHFHEDIPKENEEIIIGSYLLIPKKVNQTHVSEIYLKVRDK